VPSRLVPAVAGSAVVALALPVFLVAGWRLAGWGLGAVLWVGAQLLALLLARLRPGADNLAASGVLALGMMFRGIAVMVVLIAVAASDARLALAAAGVYVLAYTLELGLSLLAYFVQEPQR
jgi:hypothetical protein